ncbi:MAG: hypothetical protein US57_C0010G0040 [Candidatus Moranbacteria bacterium GW2011_GWC2_37_73]|nr:MAG: hypothetical protein UR95_C0008G0049 [Parcubacteria group bacterium GW2011_GWC1_36_108]KKQ00029.1 MAG: hypothetical protein US09_C0024G0002 [Candidatus Moranbacteria bacterium GW2011_GWD1_36_198]KKQ00655.1 MAG: hypothetical protein US10_C0028G0002 [Candidatus Moranbacteria bacterium GW2011_GWD2_36_198]KKQ39721.1 MAG: hypothetical protein US57_C0010G0040 [Candidatus Moranbacteria bacterium GW2011_GWC2_37_73]HBU10927.1 hypothetical protein [Candidatus Moranbacteria bacterium]
MSLNEKIKNESEEKKSLPSERIYAWKDIRTAREPRETQTERRLLELKKSLNEKTQSFFKLTKIFFKDHWNLLIKSAAHNHLRIQECKRRPELGETCNLSFESYSHLKKYQKKFRLFTYSFSSTLASILIAVMALQIFFPGNNIQGATYTWAQNTWAGGADEITTATHNSNKTGWTKYFSKDANITAGDDVKLNAVAGSFVDTTDTDFNAQAKTNVYVTGSGDAGAVFALKPEGGACTDASQCNTNLICSSNVCYSPWQNSPCGVQVYKEDSTGGAGAVWKTSQTVCVGPQCVGNLLVDDNSIDFSAYTARNLCKAVDGRLATRAELLCIYTNRASLVGAWSAAAYWTNEQSSADPTDAAFYRRFTDGTEAQGLKSGLYRVRCVK